MKTINVEVKTWEKYRRPLLNFVKRYDKNVDWIFKLRRHHLSQTGTIIKLALWEGKIIAAFAFLDYGTKESLFIISPSYQNTHIGTKLLKEVIHELGVCYTKLPYEQAALLKTALLSGMVAFNYTVDNNGSMLLWLGGGQWHIDDISEQEASCE
ncbi:GNAT family N-acetyltransferase [Bacillus sp. FJAT-45350]|uniref:GNAT family N-acetyltransferase n=1 Tax=Bacillus sp. FJAT-45350 TaxID=2011014 RepID=UPI000BB91C8D|nr:GNAT family N-acetyltransferase [Bacillus sp. FJAT-45350]